MSTSDSSIPADAVAALERGKKIEAIAITRTTTRVSLKEAKDAVEAHLAANPSSYVRFKQFERKLNGKFAILALVVAVAVVGYLLFARKL